ncbi:MAG: MBL fold metallo-hydrolase, partial [Methanobacteriota archaeon]
MAHEDAPRRTRTPRGSADLFVAQFVDEDLGNAAHLVGSRKGKVGAVIDPLRDVDPYLEAADRYGVRIAYALDTHLHNDFLSGSRELAEEADAEVGASAEARAEFPHRPLREGDRLDLGGYALEVLATPGHTPEHIAFLLKGPGRREPLALFSGGSLIVGGAARTDLLGRENTDGLTRKLYRTIHDKLLALPDEVVVYPTHGAGSFCVAPASADRTTTIGVELKQNPLVLASGEDDFVRRALDGLPSYPAYFRELRPINRRGPKVLRGLPSPKPLPPEEVDAWNKQVGAVLDVRHAQEFLREHIPTSYGIPLEAPLVTWAGWLIPYGAPLVLVARGPQDLEEATRQLMRIGFDDLRGYLKGGIPAWK